VALAKDFPEYSLHESDLATIVEIHQGGPAQETGYSLEIFNAVGETIALLVVEESSISPVTRNEILHVRQLSEVATI
jgi:hypothetical protein